MMHRFTIHRLKRLHQKTSFGFEAATLHVGANDDAFGCSRRNGLRGLSRRSQTDARERVRC